MSNTYIKLIEAVDLDKIFLNAVNCERFPATEFKGDIQTEMSVSQSLQFQTDDKFFAQVIFDVIAHDEYDEDKRLFQISCNYILEYRVDKDLLTTVHSADLDEAIQTFIERNVPVNAWPYGREFISQMTTRMGLPALVIGTYKYIPTSENED